MSSHPKLSIPALDLRAQHAALGGEVEAAVRRVLESGRYIGGPEVGGLEGEFAALCGVPHAVAVNSGTDALRFALIAAGVGVLGGDGEGQAERRMREESDGGPDEVITSPFTFIAATEAISQAGARPVFVDIDPHTFGIDPARLQAALTPRTRAIIPVYLYGQPAGLAPLLDLARDRRLAVIEDACQAHGARWDDRPAGSLGAAGCFSFYPTKNLGGCGEGGMVTTGSEAIAARVRRLRDHGQSDKYRHAEEGYNGRMDALQAAILRVKLKRLPAWNERRRAIAARYRRRLGDSAAAAAKRLILPTEDPRAHHVYHLFTVRVPGRERIREALGGCGVETGVHYPIPLHLQPCYAWMGLGEGSFPQAERAASEVMTLPIYPELTDARVDAVCDALLEALRA